MPPRSANPRIGNRPQLTQGFINLVIDRVEDTQTLKNISLVSRACRPRCKAKLFQKITISMTNLDQTLHRFDSDSLNIFGYVQDLTIGNQPKNPQAHLTESNPFLSAGVDPYDTNWHIPPESLQRLTAFLPKLTAVKKLSIVGGHWKELWAILPASSVAHLYSRVTTLHVHVLTFPNLEQHAAFILRFQRLSGLVIGDNSWDGVEEWQTREPSARRMRVDPPARPLTSLDTLEIWQNTGFAVLERVLAPPSRDPDLHIQSLVLGCDINRDFEDIQNILDRTRDHLEELEIRLLGEEEELKGDNALDLSQLDELRTFTCRMNIYTFTQDEEDLHQSTLLDLVTSLPYYCEEIRILDIPIDLETRSTSSDRYFQQLGLVSLDKILNLPHRRRLRRLVFGANLISYRKGKKKLYVLTVKSMVHGFMVDHLRRTFSRGVEFDATVDDEDAMEMPF